MEWLEREMKREWNISARIRMEDKRTILSFVSTTQQEIKTCLFFSHCFSLSFSSLCIWLALNSKDWCLSLTREVRMLASEMKTRFGEGGDGTVGMFMCVKSVCEHICRSFLCVHVVWLGRDCVNIRTAVAGSWDLLRFPAEPLEWGELCH